MLCDTIKKTSLESRMKQKKLAELAGVSVATVSKAFSGSREISEETRERIFEVAKREGCFDTYYKSVRERPLVALIFPEPHSEYYAHQIDLFEESLARHGADTIIGFARFDTENEARLFRELAYKMKVDAIIVSGAGEMITNTDAVPLVVIGTSRSGGENADFVVVEYQKGMRDLAEALKDYGYKKVGFVGESLTKSKELSLRRALRAVGLPVHDKFMVSSEYRFAEAGKDCMKKLLAARELPDVIVGAYDAIAIGAMLAARSAGIRVPQDLAFVGINDTSAAEYLQIPLSSLHICYENAVDEIVELVFRRMDNRNYRARSKITVPTSLVIRASLPRRK